MKREEAFIPAIHALHLAEVTARHGVSCADLLAGSELSETDLVEPEARISIETVERLVARARALTGEPALGVLLGMQMRISAHGPLGFAAMVASTLGEAIETATRFAPTRTNALDLRFVTEGERAILIVDERVPLGAARDVVLFALLEGMRQIGRALTGKAIVTSYEFAFPEPSYYSALALPIRSRFARSQNRLVFERRALDLPIVMSDPAAFRLATQECERALAEVHDARKTTTRVRAVVTQRGTRSIEGVAKVLGTSSRTLKRRLAAESTSFKALVDDLRRDEAVRLVETSELRFEEIAERVGYSDLANFTRAFRRWTGASPRAWRRRHLAHDARLRARE